MGPVGLFIFYSLLVGRLQAQPSDASIYVCNVAISNWGQICSLWLRMHKSGRSASCGRSGYTVVANTPVPLSTPEALGGEGRICCPPGRDRAEEHQRIARDISEKGYFTCSSLWVSSHIRRRRCPRFMPQAPLLRFYSLLPYKTSSDVVSIPVNLVGCLCAIHFATLNPSCSPQRRLKGIFVLLILDWLFSLHAAVASTDACEWGDLDGITLKDRLFTEEYILKTRHRMPSILSQENVDGWTVEIARRQRFLNHGIRRK